MFTTPGKSLAPWVLFPKQESYLSYINLNYKNLNFTIKFKTKIKIYNFHYNPQESISSKFLKNQMKKNKIAMIVKNQLVGIKKREVLHTFSAIPDVIDVSNELNSNLALISLNFRELFTV